MSSNNSFAVLHKSDAEQVLATSPRKTSWADETQEEVDRAIIAEELALDDGRATVQPAKTPLAAETLLAVSSESRVDTSNPPVFPDSWDEYMETMPMIFGFDPEYRHDPGFAAGWEDQDWFGAGLSHADNSAITAADLQRIHEEAEKLRRPDVVPSSPAGDALASDTEQTEDLRQSDVNTEELKDSTDETEDDSIYASNVGNLLDYLSDTESYVSGGLVNAEDLQKATKKVTGECTIDREHPEVAEEGVAPAHLDPLEEVIDDSRIGVHTANALDGDEVIPEDKGNIAHRPVVTRKKNYRTKAERARAKKRTAAANSAVTAANDEDSVQKVALGLSDQEIVVTYTAPHDGQHVVEDGRSTSRQKITANLPWSVGLITVLMLLAAFGITLYELEMM